MEENLDVTRIATRREWLVHRAHQMSPGQVFGCWLVGIGVLFTAGLTTHAFALAGLRFHREVHGLPLEAIFLPWCVFGATATLTILPMCLAGIRMLDQATCGLRFRLMRLRRAIQLSIRRGRHRGESIDLDGLGLLAMLLVMLISGCFVTTSLVLDLSRQSPLLGMIGIAAALLFLGMLITGLIPQLLGPTDMGRALGVIPAARDLPLPSRARCAVCDEGLQDRRLHRRMWRSLQPRVERVLSRMGRHSSWISYLLDHRGMAGLFLTALVLIALIGTSNSSALDALITLSSFVALALLAVSLTPGPSLFDAYFAPPSWKRVLGMILSMAGAALMLYNVRCIRRLLTIVQREGAQASITVEPDQAVLFIITLELLALYCLVNWCLTLFGYSLRWRNSTAVRSFLLPLLGFALGAISANWAWMAAVSLLAWMAATSKSYRDKWHASPTVTQESSAGCATQEGASRADELSDVDPTGPARSRSRS